MAILPIVIAPDPRLKQKSLPVETVDDEIKALAKDMLETMYNAHGIGLAAVQIGVHKRVIVVDVEQEGDHKPIKPLVFINAEVVKGSEEHTLYQEGCLSFPQQFSDVERPTSVTIRFLDENGKQQEQEFDGLLATCIQHEIDHTDGVVFVDHISKLKREMINKKLEKGKKRGDFEHIYEPHDHGHVHYHDGEPCTGHH